MGIVVRFDGPRIRRENAELHAAKTAEPLTAEELRLVRMVAWEKFQLATRAMVTAQNAMNEAHSQWLDADLKLFAANAAEKVTP